MAELLFIMLVLVSTLVLASALIALARGRRQFGWMSLRWLAISWGVYLIVVAVVAISTPQRVLKKGEELCFDEMCLAIANVEHHSQLQAGNNFVHANGHFEVVSIRVSNRGRGRAQRENGIVARLWDHGQYYDVSPRAQHAWISQHGPTPSLTDRVKPGQSFVTVQVFDVPTSASGLGLVVDHGLTPGYLVIGESPLFHKPTVIQMD